MVASEVKQLARQTAEATADISRRIAGLPEEASGSMAAINEITQVIERINALQLAVAGAVEEQAATTATLSATVGSVAESTDGIANRAAGIAEAMSGITACTQQTEASAHMVATAAEDMRTGVAGFTI